MSTDIDRNEASWRRVLPAGELGPDELRTVTIEGVAVLLVRSGDAVIACPPLCPHQEEELEDTGLCSEGVLTCTKHLWQWILPEGEPTGEAEQPLLLYPTMTADGFIWVSFDGELRYGGDPSSGCQARRQRCGT